MKISPFLFQKIIYMSDHLYYNRIRIKGRGVDEVDMIETLEKMFGVQKTMFVKEGWGVCTGFRFDPITFNENIPFEETQKPIVLDTIIVERPGLTYIGNMEEYPMYGVTDIKQDSFCIVSMFHNRYKLTISNGCVVQQEYIGMQWK